MSARAKAIVKRIVNIGSELNSFLVDILNDLLNKHLRVDSLGSLQVTFIYLIKEKCHGSRYVFKAR
jgi:hypothetical protein